MVVEHIALNTVEGLGPVRISNLLSHCGSPRAVLDQEPSELVRTGGFSLEIARRIKDPALLEQAGCQLEAAQRAGVEVLTLDDRRYPSQLREIFAPPTVLFVKGSLDVFSQHAVAVVGTRAATQYGRNATSSIVRGLVAAKLTIVSGLALGIDSVAHESCLDSAGRTIAVLGCGIDTVYPLTNRKLGERICQRGVLVSEFPVGTRPLPFNFPRRNRIISGLSAGVIVVEAGQRSGSLITANYALQQGRDVFAVPGSIFSDKSVGTHNLIKSGATPVRTAADVLDALQTIRHMVTTATTSIVGFPEDLLSERERGVLSKISGEPLRVDELAGGTGAAIAELLDTLLSLELKGAIKQVSGQQFMRV